MESWSISSLEKCGYYKRYFSKHFFICLLVNKCKGFSRICADK